MPRCKLKDVYDVNNYDLFALFFIIQTYIFLKINFNKNGNVNLRYKDLTDCLISDEYFDLNRYENHIDMEATLKWFYSSVYCISFNRTLLLKGNTKLKFYIGGTNIKLSSPRYYYNKYKLLINIFYKNIKLYNSKIEITNEYDPKLKNKLKLFILSEAIEYILNQAGVSLDDYNKNTFSGSLCLTNGNIISNSLEICLVRDVDIGNEHNAKLKKCPLSYKLHHRKDNQKFNPDTDKITNINERLETYNDIISNKTCCKDKNDAEIDILLSILRDNLQGINIYEQYNNLWNFLNDNLLNPESNEYIGNYGLFCMNNQNNPITACWICKKWLSYYGCNYFTCGIDKFKNILTPKIKLNLWLPKKYFIRIVDILRNDYQFILKTSFCYLNIKLDKVLLTEFRSKRNNKKKKIKYYSEDNIYFLDILDYLKYSKFNYLEWKYEELLDQFGIPHKIKGMRFIIKESDSYYDIISKFKNYNQKIYNTTIHELCK